MKFNAFSPIPTLIFAGLLISFPSASGSYYDAPWENRTLQTPGLVLEPFVSLLTTSMNFDPNGAASIPSGLDSYRKIRFGSKGSLQIFDGLTLYGVFSATSVQLTTQSFSGNQFQLGDQVFGGNWRVVSFSTRAFLFFQGEAQIPLYSNASSASSGLPFIGDGTIDLTGGPLVRWNLLDDNQKRLSIDAGMAYTYRSNGFSSHLPYILGGTLTHFQKNFWVGLDLLGVFSLGSDASTNQGFSQPLSAAGGSFAVNGINSSIMDIRFRGGYRFGPSTALTAQVQQTLWGKSAPKETQLALGFEWALLGTKEPAADSAQSENSKGTQGQSSDDGKFVTYDLPSRVIDVNDRLSLIKINQGKNNGLRVGMEMTVFKTGPDGQIIEAIARAKVKEVKSSEAILKIEEYFKEVWIEKGFVVKRPME